MSPGATSCAERAAGGRRDDARDAQRLHRPEVRTVVDRVRREAMILSVAGEKGDALPGDLAEREPIAWSAVGRLDGDFSGVFKSE